MTIAININNPEVSVGAENIASREIAVWGGSGRLPVYDDMEATIVDSDVIINSGIYSNQGYEIEIPQGETETFAIDTESIGIKRYDIVASELSRTDSVETHTIKIIKGTAAINPVLPALVEGDFKGGEDLRQEAIHTLLIDGTTITVASSAPILSGGHGGGDSGRTIYVQSAQPASPKTGDLWFW